jgi:hypothetical protein
MLSSFVFAAEGEAGWFLKKKFQLLIQKRKVWVSKAEDELLATGGVFPILVHVAFVRANEHVVSSRCSGHCCRRHMDRE